MKFEIYTKKPQQEKISYLRLDVQSEGEVAINLINAAGETMQTIGVFTEGGLELCCLDEDIARTYGIKVGPNNHIQTT